MTPERPVRLALALAGTAALVLSTAAAVLADSPAPASAAPAASGVPAASGAAASGGGNAISIVQKTFQPNALTVHVGDKVTWTVTQAISDPHSVTSGSYKDASTAGKVFDSGIKLKNNGDSFSFTFTSAGTFPFFCAVHPDTMSGTITVTDANGSTGGTGAAGAEGAVPTSSKAIAAVILVVALVVLFGWARLYQRMNRA
jgi:plastocyanin